ncbi:tetratricopeptide repeat protein [Cryobacterium sp. Sr8]|uniref:tetratricopeptide repeat protein n=1 Tax=Cryobacterium sp. Sr8 TaxID=1259203 RepID=UPI00106AF895|nr:tetratricopeptide repeat protein [Cryobacterium sp. Sr8]TFD78724.1 tetratricopeptide repeat protein [Cryobacterium sp. Sr8]
MTNLPPSGVNLRGAVDLSSLVNRAAAPAPGAPAAGAGVPVPVPSLVLEGTDANFGEVLELSMTVPVIVDLWAEWCGPCKQLTPVLEKLTAEFGGRIVLAKVDVDSNPQLSQAFAAQSIPTVAAVVGGQPVQLFSGAIPEAQVREVFERVLELAAQHGVTGTAQTPAGDDAPDEAAEALPAEPELPPHHREAFEAIERGDYDVAISEYSTALAKDPRDQMAVAGLAQVRLLARLQGKSIAEIRSAAAAGPDELDAQLLVADLDLSGGHVEDAFDRLLTLFPAQDAAGKNTIRERILELFQVVGLEDPRVPPTRSRLTALLY